MNNETAFVNEFPIEGEETGTSIVRSSMPIIMAGRNSYLPSSAKIIERAESAMTYEQCGAVLAKTALDNIGALSAYEQHLTKVAPTGKQRYKAIVDRVTLNAIEKLARWK